jgi:hypothetical protein
MYIVFLQTIFSSSCLQFFCLANNSLKSLQTNVLKISHSRPRLQNIMVRPLGHLRCLIVKLHKKIYSSNWYDRARRLRELHASREIIFLLNDW